MILRANAKINIGLQVIGRRADGYHNLQTVFYPLQLHDILIAERIGQGIEMEEGTGIRVDCKQEDNLIVRTARRFAERYGTDGIRLHIEKRIPFGAGLGGGSSDAAHTALAINELFGLGLHKEQLREEVSALGADCAFFIENTPCYAEGIGDKLTPLKALGTDLQAQMAGKRLVLVKPEVYVSTAAAYKGIRPRTPEEPLTEILKRPLSEWKGHVCNDFEKTVFPWFPTIAETKERLYKMGAEYASMSGSGASVFGIFPTGKEWSEEETKSLFAGCFVHTEIL